MPDLKYGHFLSFIKIATYSLDCWLHQYNSIFRFHRSHNNLDCQPRLYSSKDLDHYLCNSPGYLLHQYNRKDLVLRQYSNLEECRRMDKQVWLFAPLEVYKVVQLFAPLEAYKAVWLFVLLGEVSIQVFELWVLVEEGVVGREAQLEVVAWELGSSNLGCSLHQYSSMVLYRCLRNLK